MSINDDILNTLEELSKIKHNLNKKILDEIAISGQKSTNNNLKSLVKTGVDLANNMLEGGRSLEKTILSNLKSGAASSAGSESEQKPEDSNMEANTPKDGMMGTILIRTEAKANEISVPINISNNDNDAQDVSVKTSYFKNMESGKQAMSKINIEQPNLTLKPNSSERAVINFEVGPNLKPGNKYFTSIQLNGKEERSIQVILEVVPSGEKLSKPEVKFNPAAG
jgi:hypothetical protein